MNINLVLTKKDGTSRSFSLPSTVTVIGRRRDCDLCIPLMLVSRRHCELNQDNEELHLRDLGSKNGTLLNGEKIDSAKVNPGDKIQIGPIKFIIQINGKPSLSEIKEISSKEHAMNTISGIASDDLLSESQELDATTNGDISPDYQELLNKEENRNKNEDDEV